VALDVEDVARIVVDAGFKIHTTLGPGLLETVYERCLVHELQLRGLAVRSQVYLPVIYEGLKIDAGYRLDVLVDEQLVVEVKSVDALLRVHQAQLATYLKLTELRLGLLMNFKVALFKEGVKRIAR
jgi:GxxExxY protein